VRWSAPATLPGGGLRLGRRSVLEHAALVFGHLPSVTLDRISIIVAGNLVTARGRYRTCSGQGVDFVDQLRVRDGRIAALHGALRAEQVRNLMRAR
jgi:hypothetical protein